MHTSGIHTRPYGLFQVAAPQTDRVPGMRRTDQQVDLGAVIDRMTINTAKSREGGPTGEPERGKSALSPAHVVKAEGTEPGRESLFGTLVAAQAQSHR
jgi:hypothetical protein